MGLGGTAADTGCRCRSPSRGCHAADGAAGQPGGRGGGGGEEEGESQEREDRMSLWLSAVRVLPTLVASGSI